MLVAGHLPVSTCGGIGPCDTPSSHHPGTQPGPGGNKELRSLLRLDSRLEQALMSQTVISDQVPTIVIICIKDIVLLSAFGLFELRRHLLFGSCTLRPPVMLPGVRNHLYLLGFTELSQLLFVSSVERSDRKIGGKLQVKAASVNRLSVIEYRIINSSGTRAFSQPLLCVRPGPGCGCNCIRQLSVNTKRKQIVMP